MIRAIVTDIEGTTSSLSFVKDILFPYARQHMGDYLRSHVETTAIQAELAEIRRITNQPHLSVEEIITQLIQWLDEDKKITPLKTIQGYIWEEGYQRGDYQGHIYSDAVNKLQEWHQQQIILAVYSSGSIYAQKLLFSHTAYGDLTPLFSAYFDTTIGAKIDSKSYLSIAESLNLPPASILFLSDVEKELDAAKEAGLQTIWLVREGEINTEANHLQVKDFGTIQL
jgi:enolase-phosphatase E1